MSIGTNKIWYLNTIYAQQKAQMLGKLFLYLYNLYKLEKAMILLIYLLANYKYVVLIFDLVVLITFLSISELYNRHIVASFLIIASKLLCSNQFLQILLLLCFFLLFLSDFLSMSDQCQTFTLIKQSLAFSLIIIIF